MFQQSDASQLDTFTRLKLRVMQALLVAITVPLFISLLSPLFNGGDLAAVFTGNSFLLILVFSAMFFTLLRYPAMVNIVTNVMIVFLGIFGIFAFPEPGLSLIAWGLPMMVMSAIFAPVGLMIAVDALLAFKLYSLIDYTQDGTSSAVIVGVIIFLFVSMSILLRYFVNLFQKSLADTEKRSNELELVSQVSAEASTVMDLNQLLIDVSNLTKERFHLYHAHIYLLNDAGDTLVLRAGAGEAGKTMVAENRTIRLDAEQSLVARAARELKGVIVNDVTANPNFLPHPSLPNTKAEMAIPMIVAGKVIGVLDTQADKVGFFTDDDLRVKTTLAAQIAVAVQNAGAFEKIKEAQKQAGDLRDAIDESAIVAITDVTGKITYVNDKFCEISKYSREELIGQDHRIINSGAHSKEFIKNVWTTIANGKIWKGEFENRAKDGSPYWVDTTIVPFLNDQGKPYQYIAIRYDITERKQQELEIQKRAQEIETVAQVGTQLATNLDMNELMWTVANLTQTNFNRYHVNIYLMNDDESHLDLVAASGKVGQELVANEHHIPLSKTESIVVSATLTKKTVVVDDVDQSPTFLPNKLLPETRAEMAVPIILDNHVIGVLDIQDNKAHAFDHTEIQAKTVLANQIATTIQNARSFENITKARQEVERVFNSSLDMMGSANFEGYFTSLNAAWQQTLGWTVEELTAEPFISFVHPEDVERTNAEAARLFSGESSISFENRYITKNGDYRWISWNVSADMENSLLHFVARDITAQKRVTEGQELLLHVANELNKADSLDDLLEAVSVPANLNQADSSTMLLIELDANNQPEWATVATTWKAREDVAVTPVGMRFYLPEFAVADLWLQSPNQPLFIGDIQTDERVDEGTRQTYLATNSYSTVIMPMYNDGKWLGLISISWTAPQTFTPQDEYLYNAINRQAIITLDALQSNEAIRIAREQAETLANINSKLARANDEQDILDAISAIVAPYNSTLKTMTYLNTDENGEVFSADIVAARSLQGPLPLSVFPTTHLDKDSFNMPSDPNNMDLLEDVANTPYLTEDARQFMLNSGVGATIALPLHAGGRWLGVLSFVWPEATSFAPELLNMLRAVMPNASSIVASRRAYVEAEVQQKLSNRRARELETVAQVTTEASTMMDLERLLVNVSNLTKDRFNLYHAHIYLMNNYGDTLVLAAGAGEAGQTMVAENRTIALNAERSLVASAARQRQGVIVNNVMIDPNFLPHPMLPDTKAEMAVPLIVGENVIGVLDVQANVTDRFTQEDVRVMTTLAGQIAVAVQNARSFENVTKARLEVERVFNSSLDMMGSANFEGYFTSLNAAWEQTLGWTLDELKAEPFISFVHPDDVERTNAEAARLFGGESTISFENRYRAKDGSYHWISWNTSADMETSLLHFVARDITDAKRNLESQELLLEVANMLNRAETMDDLLQAIITPSVLRNATNSTLLLFELDENNHPDWATVAAGWEKSEEGMISPSGTRFQLSDFPISSLWWESPYQPMLFNNVLTDERVDAVTREVYVSIRSAATITIPLFNMGKWLGVVTISWDTPQNFTAQDEYLYSAITQQAIITLDAIQSNEAIRIAREQAETLANINSSLARANDEQDILDAISAIVAPYNASLKTMTYLNTDAKGEIVSADIVAARTTDGPLPLTVFPTTHLGKDSFNMPSDPNNMDILEDVENSPYLTEDARQFMLSSGVGATIAIPLHSGNRWLGVLSFVWPEATQFTPELLNMLRAVMPNASSIVASRRAYVEAQVQRELSAQRARELETVAEVSTATTTILNVEELLQSVADLTRDRFDLYHSHIYLIDEETHRLVMTAGAGDAGRIMKANQHSISMQNQRSLVALAANSGVGVIVNNTLDDPNFLPNPLLPETKSEMAVPMRVAGQVIGVLDVQSDKVNNFTEQDLRIQATLADQVAVAVQNALLFAETEQQAERERETAERLREVDRLKSQFLANMSHELRTPLNSIIGYSEVLLDGVDGELTEDAEEDVQAIHNSGKHLLSIINEILDLAKIEAGEMRLDVKDVDVVEFVNEIVRNGQVLVKNKDVDLNVIQEDDLPLVSADEVRLRQIIWNLISNAVKFTEQGSVNVRLSLVDHKKFVRIAVEDSGVGMTQEGLEVIFERFSQVDGSSTRRAGGTGLGLTITKQLVEMHGGHINVESIVGEGSTFAITLPVKVTEKA